MKANILKIEEKQMNFIMFLAGVFVPIVACIFVILFLGGTCIDTIVLTMTAESILIRILEPKLGKLAKYLYVCIMPIGGALVIIIANDGKFIAMTQAYLLWLLLSIAYYNVKVVKVCAAATLITNIVAMSLFPASYLKMHNIVVWSFILLVYLVAVIMAIIITSKTEELFEKEELLKSYEREVSYYEELQKKDLKYSEFIHNINHYFMAIGELVKQGNYNYILNILEDLNVEMQDNESMIYTNYKVLNAVLSKKKNEAEEKDIIFDAYVEPGVKLNAITDSDLVAMLANLLDNAIRAVSQCRVEEREIITRIYMEQKGRICVIKMENPFEEEIIQGKKGFISTKKEEGIHGIGIKSIGNMAEKYNGYLECFAEQKKFTAILILPV